MTGELDGSDITLHDGAVVIAAITSCTNTSNPSVMIGAGLVAKKAVERGLTTKPWVKTSLAPGSRVVTDYLEGSGLLPYLEQLRSIPWATAAPPASATAARCPSAIAGLIDEHSLVTAAVLSGNRNFEARVHPQVRANYLASPMLVVAFALAGRVDIDLAASRWARQGRAAGVPAGHLADAGRDPGRDGRLAQAGAVRRRYGAVFEGDETWQALQVPRAAATPGTRRRPTCRSRRSSSDLPAEPPPLRDIAARGCWRCWATRSPPTTSRPAGSIPKNGPAARYLLEHGVEQVDWNTFGSRRGNHEVMMRGTFGNVRIAQRAGARARRATGRSTSRPAR